MPGKQHRKLSSRKLSGAFIPSDIIFSHYNSGFFFVKSKVFDFVSFLHVSAVKAFKQEIIVANLPVYDKMKISYTYYYMCIYKDNVLI